jgi:DNA/RNA-binding domain of Phe-tRNA-synthetase-like protein
MSPGALSVAPDLEPIVALAMIGFQDLRVADLEPRLDDPLDAVAERLRRGDAPQAGIAAVRTMYRRIGLDPTKRRPSSEALLRRIRKGQPLPRINALVDVCNWCSVEFQLPYGLYDRSRVDGDIVLRLGRAGEQYEGIRKDVVHLAGRPTLADARGPFGNPSSDSARTMVTAATTDALIVIYAPRAMGSETLGARAAATASRVLEFVGGVEVSRRIA